MRVALLLLLWCSSAFSQTTNSSASTASPSESAPAAQPFPDDLPQIVRRQFGPDFAIALQRSSATVRYLHPANDPWTPFLTMDVDQDGIEDAVIVTRSKNPLKGQGTFNYKVVDPYFTHHGYGDPKITATLTSEDPDHGHVVLVIHGAGDQAWHAAVPKAKFAIVNLPFDNLSVTRTANGKRVALNLESREATMNSIVFWDGKKYRWKEE